MQPAEELPGIRLAKAQHTLTSQACRTMKVWSRTESGMSAVAGHDSRYSKELPRLRAIASSRDMASMRCSCLHTQQNEGFSKCTRQQSVEQGQCMLQPLK